MLSKLSNEEIAHLIALAEAATPGPWKRGSWSGRCYRTDHINGHHTGKNGSDPCRYERDAAIGSNERYAQTACEFMDERNGAWCERDGLRAEVEAMRGRMRVCEVAGCGVDGIHHMCSQHALLVGGEALVVEAIAEWLDQVSSDFVNSSRRQAIEEAAQMIRGGAWRPK